jgi:hypothetical protein
MIGKVETYLCIISTAALQQIEPKLCVISLNRFSQGCV